MYKILALCIASVFLFGCEPRHRRHHKHKETVKSYHVHNTSDDTWLYYYMFQDSATRNYYYCSSPTPLPSSSLSSATWSKSATEPEALDGQGEVLEALDSEEMTTDELGEIGSEVDTEGGWDSDNGMDSDTGTDSDSGSDAGSDGGGGGGDSGGGDGGGGGGGE